ncbi:unnamed protein product [Coffea canephora]|uniref:Uncharacterized protein n=1 Tax=Coffea canephora TaxID=49390 RepID=A0A068UWD2_COFCA|nr:unnamed protein product [Coffea canephora]
MFTVKGKTMLSGVPENIVSSPASGESIFNGPSSTSLKSRRVFNLGVLDGYRFLCNVRFKIWWMIPSFGNQVVRFLWKLRCFSWRALKRLSSMMKTSLQGSSDNQLQLNFHTLNFHFSNAPGDPNVQTCEVKEALFINSGVNPCELIKNSIKILSKHKGTFSHVDGKKVQIAAVAFNRLFEGEIVAVDWDIFQVRYL